jgi:hypothetical protein
LALGSLIYKKKRDSLAAAGEVNINVKLKRTMEPWLVMIHEKARCTPAAKANL